MAPLGCVDLGTNTCLLLVAAPSPVGARVLHDESRIVRLGQGVDRDRRLHPDARARVMACLMDYAETARRLGANRKVLVATSAMRDAVDGQAFADEIHARTGFEARIIGGDEEAALTWASASRDFGPGPLAAFDVGGGSTEVIVGRGANIRHQESINVGGVRLTERFLHSDPPSPAELDALQRSLSMSFSTVTPLEAGTRLVGLAGTLTTLACMARRMPRHDPQAVHGTQLSLVDAEDLFHRLAAMGAAERAHDPALDDGRADVIVAGAAIVVTMMRACGVNELVVSNGGVRWGLFWSLASG